MEKYNFMKIFRSTKFGVEFESCNDITIKLPSNVGINANNRKHGSMVNFYNRLIETSRVPLIYDETMKPLDKFTFSKSVLYHPNDSGSLWTLQVDSSIRCDDNSYTKAEIVTPIMYMGDDNYNSEYSNGLFNKNKIWIELEKNFKDNDCYFEGLFVMLSWYNLMFNNMEKKKEEPHVYQYNTDDNGLHVHISNTEIQNNKKGILCLAHFLRTFYFFENLIGHFLTENRRNNKYCIKMRDLYKKKNRQQKYDLDIKENLLSVIKGVYFQENKLLSYLTIHDEFNITNDRYVTVNLANNITGTKNQRKVIDNLRMEIRYHQSVDNIDQVYNWVLFLNMILSTCISEMSEVYDLISTNPDKANSLFDKYNSSFMNRELYNNNHVNVNMFNLLFSRFCPNNELKDFYLYYCDSNYIQNNPNILDVNNSLQLHPEEYFDLDGSLLEDNPMVPYQKNMDYRVNIEHKKSNEYKKKYFKYNKKYSVYKNLLYNYK